MRLRDCHDLRPTLDAAHRARRDEFDLGAYSGLGDFASTVTAPDFVPASGPVEFNTPGTDVPAPSFLSKVGSGIGDAAGKVGTGLSNFASKLGDEITDNPLKSLTTALGLGATGFGVAGSISAQKQAAQQMALTKKSQAEASAAAKPAVDFGTTTLNNAAAGNLPAPLQASIDQWTQQQKAAIASRFASMGMGNSDQIEQANALVDQQAMAMKGQLLQQQEETGLAGLQTGVSAATGVMGSSQQQQQQLEALIAQANKAMGSLGGAAPS